MFNKFKAYAQLLRLERPVGTLLLLWSALWGLWLAGEGRPPAQIVFIFLLGSWTTRSLGCALNDLADRNFDGKVERTKNRPLASGALSVSEALFAIFILALMNLFLVFQLNSASIYFAFFCLFISGFYPLCKRFFPVPQLVLGFAFASPILMAQLAILGKLTLSGIILYLASVIWALIYDTFYALVDRNDDEKIGLLSSAIWIKGREKRFLITMMGLMLALLFLVGLLANLNYFYYLSLFFTGLLFAYQIVYTRNNIRERFFEAFIHNNWVGAMIFTGIVLNYLPK